jgi:DNA replication protein DnaC
MNGAPRDGAPTKEITMDTTNDLDVLLARMPPSAVERARREGSRTREDYLGDIAGERREQLRADRARLWATALRNWPDDDFTGATLNTLSAAQKPRAVQAWIHDPDAKSLILVGATGRGKTYTAFAIGNHYAAQGAYVVAVSHKRYLDSLEPDGGDEPAWLIRRRVANAEVLIVDGFGDEMDPTKAASEFRTRETADLLSTRLGRGKRTIISTNLKSDQLALMFGDRVISRLRQCSTALAIEGVDRRAVGAKW